MNHSNETSSAASRLDILNTQLHPFFTAASQPRKAPKGNFSDCWSHLGLNEYLSPKALKMKAAIEKFNDDNHMKYVDYIERKEFPTFFVDGMREIGVNGLNVKGFGSPELTILETGAMYYALGREDAGLGLILFLQNGLGIAVLDHCCSEEQKQRFLPELIKFNKLTCFGLTEPDNGSDATNLSTVAKKVDGGYILNGAKRWPGNGVQADWTIIWAKNLSDGNKIQGFIVEKGMKGHSASVIPNKIAARLVQNSHIELKDVFVPDANRLAKADNFETGLNAVLMASRLTITFIFAGQMAGAFEYAYKHAMNRVQFGKPIAGFQLTQEKLVRILGDIQACLTLLIRVGQNFQAGKATMGQIAMVKAHVSRISRDVTRVAREIQGASGIVWESMALKQMIDAEASYTGEGSYDVNILVAGRELTGLAAFK